MLPIRMDWELTGNSESLRSVITAAYSLASRFSGKTQAIRSWNQTESHLYNFSGMDENFLVIIDSMCSTCSQVRVKRDAIFG